jgi:hypothetical protein
MANGTTKMLKDLLERVESGEIVITNFRVSDESVEFDAEVGSSEPPVTRLTGEQTFYITTKPGVKKPTQSPSGLFADSVNRFGKTVNWLASYRPYKAEVDDLIFRLEDIIRGYEMGNAKTAKFVASCIALRGEMQELMDKLNKLDLESRDRARLLLAMTKMTERVKAVGADV